MNADENPRAELAELELGAPMARAPG